MAGVGVGGGVLVTSRNRKWGSNAMTSSIVLYRPPHALLSLMRAAMASPIAPPLLPPAPRARSTRGSAEASEPIRGGGSGRERETALEERERGEF